MKNYYLAFIRTYGKEDGHYELVKAASKDDALDKVERIVGYGKIIDILDTIE